MPGTTELENFFGDGDYLFSLKLPQVMELQRACGAGIFAIYARIMKGRGFIGDDPVGLAHDAEAYEHDIYETIRLALIGGGHGIVNGAEVKVDAIRARQLIETYAHTSPMKPMWDLAAAILYAKIEGYEPKKKAPAANAKPGRRRGSTKPK